MEKENKFMLKFSKIFTSSCKTQNLSEVIDHQNPIFTQQTPIIDENDPSSSPVIIPKQTPIPSSSPYPSMMCKPRCPESFDHMVRQSCVIPTSGNPIPRRNIAGRYNHLPSAGGFAGRRCPAASPVSPLSQSESKQGKKKHKKKQIIRKNGKFDKSHLRNHPFNFSSSNETDVGDWFSSDDEREDEEHETETLFSSSKSPTFSSKSVSLSSDSEPHNPTRSLSRVRRRRKTDSGSGRVSEKGAMPLKEKGNGTFAVVKSSRDPYNDFRTSMVEMIMEKQIFRAKELEQLLQWFLSLNSPHHHRVIVEVFTEIWDALFSYCS